MNILLTGANGFLGYYLTELLLSEGYEVIATGKGASRLPFDSHPSFRYVPMDFTDPFAVHDVFEIYKPVIVVHAGAMSKPDECEHQPWDAYLVNVEGTVTLLLNAEEYKSFFIFISTDFVFSGDTGMYKEEDPHEPVNFYGKTKSGAEEAVKEYPGDWSIVRTVMVYGKPRTGRENLLTVVEEKLSHGEPYNVFADQERTPTYVEDLAAGILAVIRGKHIGVYHISGDDILSPYDMALATARYLGLDESLLKKVNADELIQPARRPLKTGLVIDKARQELGYKPRSFTEGLQKTFEKDN